MTKKKNVTNIEEARKKLEVAPPQAVSDHEVEEKNTDPRLEMTAEEIQQAMAAEEDELNSYIGKFALMPQPDSSSVSEEDEKEETITLDLENNKAYEKIAEGIVTPDGKIHEVETGLYKTLDKTESEERVIEGANIILEQVDKVEDRVAELEDGKAAKYRNLVSDIFVRKGLAELLRKTNNSLAEHMALMESNEVPGHLRPAMAAAHKEMEKNWLALRRCIAGNVVHYDLIPDWAEEYVRNYLEDTIGALTSLAERD